MISGFFPPKLLGLAGQEEMTDHADVQVPHHSLILADLEVREAQFAFLVLQNPLDGPACEGDMQPGFQPIFSRIADEKPFFLVGVQGIVGPQEMVTAQKVIAALEPERSGLDLPDHRPFVGVLDVEGSPALARHRPGMLTKFLDAACRMARVGAGMGEPTA